MPVRRVLASLLFISAASAAGLLLLLYLFQGRLLYFPTSELTATPAGAGLEHEEVWLTARDGVRIHGWYVRAGQGEPRGTVLFLHGNAGNISHRIGSIRTFVDLGLDVLIIDYRGYGRSEGRPTERGTYQDALAAWDHLVVERGIEPGRIVLFGRSLGGAVAAWLGKRTAPAGVILESTFVSVPDLAAELYPWLPARRLVRFRYPTLERMPRISHPVLVVHSEDDEIIPVSHGRRLHEAAGGPADFLALRGGHNDAFVRDPPTYAAGIGRFLDRVLGS
jgi:uncharacterized protein